MFFGKIALFYALRNNMLDPSILVPINAITNRN